MTINWRPMSSAPVSADPVLVVFRCPLTGRLESGPCWFDDGLDEDGTAVEAPAWWLFDQSSTETVAPLAWASYPIPNEAAWAKLGNPQASA